MNLNNINDDFLINNYFTILFILIISTYFYYNNKKTKETFLPSFYQNQYTPSRLFPLLPKDIDERTFLILNSLPFLRYLENRDRSVINDPLVAPERRVPVNQYPFNVNSIINVPTRGYPENYQLLGLVSRKEDEKFLQLYGRPTFPGSNQWEYFIRTEQNGFVNKIPFQYKNGKELEDGQMVDVPGMDSSKGSFKITLYNYNTPRYNPYDY